MLVLEDAEDGTAVVVGLVTDDMEGVGDLGRGMAEMARVTCGGSAGIGGACGAGAGGIRRESICGDD